MSGILVRNMDKKMEHKGDRVDLMAARFAREPADRSLGLGK